VEFRVCVSQCGNFSTVVLSSTCYFRSVVVIRGSFVVVVVLCFFVFSFFLVLFQEEEVEADGGLLMILVVVNLKAGFSRVKIWFLTVLFISVSLLDLSGFNIRQMLLERARCVTLRVDGSCYLSYLKELYPLFRLFHAPSVD